METTRTTSGEDFFTVFHAFPDAVTINRLHDGRCLAANESFTALTGLAAAEVEGPGSWLSLEDWQRLCANVQPAGRVKRLPVTLRTKAGAVCPAEVSARHIEFQGVPSLLTIVYDLTPNPPAEAALREGETCYRDIFENAVEGIFQITPDGRVLNVNAAMARIYGYASPAEMIALIGGDVEQHIYVNPGDRARFQRSLAADGMVTDFEELNYRKDGSVICVRLNARVVRDASGTVLYYEGFLEDVTEHRKMEEALRESRQQLRLIVDNIPAIITFVDAQNLRYRFVNRVWADLHGLSPQQMLGKQIGEFLDEAAYARALPYLERARSGERVSYENIIPARGEPRWFSVNYIPEFNAQGTVQNIFVLLLDITERKRAEETLRVSEARFRDLFEYSPVALWEEDFSAVKVFLDDLRQQGVTDIKGYFTSHPDALGDCVRRIKVLDINQAAVKLHDAQSKSELLGAVDEVHKPSPEVRPFVIEQLAAIARGETVYEITRVYYKLGGERIEAILRWFIPADSQLTMSRVFVSVSDITEQKRAEAEIRRLNADLERRVDARTAELSARTVELGQANAALTQALRVKNEFLAVMSHELRTPLTAVLGLAEGLQMGIYGPMSEKQRKSLQTIHASGQHLLALINDVLDFVSVDASRLQLGIGPVAVDDLCEAGLRQIKAAVEQKKLQLTVTRDSAVKVVQGDSRRLKQVLVNLLDNAVKFTPEGGAIGLDVMGDAARREVQFSIWDTGIGIAPADHERIFEPFVQLDNRLARQYEGTGLGLALVKRLAELHGGRVTVVSEGVPGKGSRFTVCLPWNEAQS